MDVMDSICKIIQTVGTVAAAYAAYQSFCAAKESNSLVIKNNEMSLTMARRNSVLVLVELLKPIPEITSSTSENDIRYAISIFDYISHLIDAKVVEEEMIELIWGDFIRMNVATMKTMTNRLPVSLKTPVDFLNQHPKVELLANRMLDLQGKRITHR